ncbi:MAG: alpha-ketoglutarate decarboxylase [Gemmatimonadales bacterium]
MTDCGCEKARRDLEEYLRHEVCKTQQSDIAEHLAHCAECSDEALVSRTLTDAIARACQETAPEQLRDQVLATLRAAQAAH